jgi:hypothetical protein
MLRPNLEQTPLGRQQQQPTHLKKPVKVVAADRAERKRPDNSLRTTSGPYL